MLHNTKYNKIRSETMMIDKSEMPWAYKGIDPHEPRFVKPSHHDCHCNPANVASEGFVQRAISDHNHALGSHYEQFRRVYDRIEQVRKMHVVPEAIEIIDEFGKIKSRINADLTADVNGHKKRILTSDDDRRYGERFYLHNKQLKELEDKLDEIISSGTITPAKTFTFDNTDFDVSTDDVVSLKKGEISENSSQVITGHDVYSVVSVIDTRLSDFQDFYKQNSFYHFIECEGSDIVDGLTNVKLKPFATSTIPPQLTNIRITIDSAPTGIDSGVARNMVMVIPATNSATYIEWPSNFCPKTSPTVDYQCIAGIENVYWISEFSPNKFVVNGWQAKTPYDYLNKFVVFTSETDNSTISMRSVGDAPDVTLETSCNGYNWKPFIVNETTITLKHAGDSVCFRASTDGNKTFATSIDDYNNFVINGRVSASGNIMGLLNADKDLTTIPSASCFACLFKGCSALTTAPELPATTLHIGCYRFMFQGCTSLTTAPELPATMLGNSCYAYMFQGCTSLTTAPELPDISLADNCYSYMFDGCTSLTSAPELPATTLADNCYRGMFQGCTSLTTATALPANTLYSGCYSYMYSGCSSLREAPQLPVTLLVNNCYEYMFQGCTSLTTAPELPATILDKYCYLGMFQGCTSLTTSPELIATKLFTSSYESLFKDCTSLNTVITKQTSFDGCENWLDNVSPNGTLYCSYKLGIDGDIERGASACPTNWVVETVNILSFVAEDNNSSISMHSVGDAPSVTLETSFDRKNWTPFIVDETTITLENAGDRVYFRATSNSTNNSFASSNTAYNNFIISGGRVSASGNIMSIINRNSVDIIPSNYCFAGLFRDCNLLTSAPELPATTLTNSCYAYMFSGCTSLTTAPELPATNLVTDCYNAMFENCSSLNSLTTNQTSFDGCENWLSGVSETGTLYCLSTVGINDTIIRGVSACPTEWNVVNIDYLCFTAELPDSSVSMKFYGSAPTIKLVYSSAGSLWSPFIVGETTVSLPNVGDKVYIKADIDGNAAFATSDTNCNSFVMHGRVAASGNIMSLLNAKEVPTSIPAASCFACLFSGCSALTVAPELPATTLSGSCYRHMFSGCTSLTSAPELPATTLIKQCYAYMFNGCSALTVAPELPATTLAGSCYYYMFQGCTSLTTAPELPATTLAGSCYLCMFQNCTSLTSAPELPATTLADSCYRGMFVGCKSLTSAPELPATTLTGSCYMGMFQNCSSINHVRTNQTTFTGCGYWLRGVSTNGIFECLPSLGTEETITRGDSACPTGWTVVNNI